MKVSVIIPVYNVEKYIARCLDSVINQTYQDLEIIVVNDATPDNSMSIVEEYAARDPRIRIVHNPHNLGLMMTRRSGYSVATGDYLTFVDSDDYLPLNAVELLVSKAMETDADIVVGDFLINHTDGRAHVRNNSLSFGDTIPGYLQSLLTDELAHNLWAKLYKRDLFAGKNYVDYEGMVNAEDKALFYQVIRSVKKMVCSKDVVYNYVVNTQSSTNVRLSLAQIECVVRANRIAIQTCKKYSTLRGLSDSVTTKATMYLYCRGYSSHEIKSVLNKHDMRMYGSLWHAFRVLPFRDFLHILYSIIRY